MAKPTSKIIADAAIKRIEALEDEACEIRSAHYCADIASKNALRALCGLADILSQQAQVYEAAALFIVAPLARHAKQLGRVRSAYRVMARHMASHIVAVTKI